MVQYLVQKTFKDVHNGKIYDKGTTQDFTVKRAKEIEKNLDSSFLMRKDDKK